MYYSMFIIHIQYALKYTLADDLFQGKSKDYANKLCDWITKQGFAKVVILSSIFAHERRDKQIQGYLPNILLG